MKPIKFSSDFVKYLQVLKRKNPKLLLKIYKQLQLFQQNPRHQSLRLHKLTGELKNSWSISIDEGFRMLYTEIDGSAYFFKIGSHDEVYRKK